MSEVLFTKDNSYFFMKSKDLQKAGPNGTPLTDIMKADVISLEVTEEMNKLITGSITVRDPFNVWSQILRVGLKFDLEWGYKDYVNAVQRFKLKKLGADELVGQGYRSGMSCIMQQPSGGASERGEVTYTMQFYGEELLTESKTKTYSSNTYKDVIIDLLNEVGVIRSQDYIVDFDGMDKRLSSRNMLHRSERAFRMLSRLAFDFQAEFMLGYGSDGFKRGIFVSSKKVGSSDIKSFLNAQAGSITGLERKLYYNAGQASNVISYSWRQNIGESAQGDAVTVQEIDGQLVFQRYRAEDGAVTTWKLNKDKIKAKFKEFSDQGKAAKFLRELVIKPQKFTAVQWAFDQISSKTAPQGMGYGADIRMRGDPSMVIPTRIVFQKGFPPPLTQNQDPNSLVQFWVRKVKHTMNKQGYYIDATVTDSYTQNGSFLEQGSRVNL